MWQITPGALRPCCRGGHPGEVYNIGGQNEWANLDIVRLLCRVLDERFAGGRDVSSSDFLRHRRRRSVSSESLIEFVTDRAGHDWRYAIDASKIES